jgi:mono/diheme cytochrome c family protein
MHYVRAIAGLAVAAIVAGLGIMYSGIIDVGATQPHHALTRWLLHTGMEQSVRHHARGIKVPPLVNPQMVMMGFRHYREMCMGCHLAPGIQNSEIRQGLIPRPPKLQQAARRWTPAELFWIVKNGVRMTAMPAWGATHSDDKLWAIVAFLKKLPDMTAAQYQQMEKGAGPSHSDDEHAAEADSDKGVGS